MIIAECIIINGYRKPPAEVQPAVQQANPSNWEGGKVMSEIKVKENESLDSALRRFKRSCAKDGIMGEVRKREHYDKPSVRRKKKSEAARKRKFK